MASMASATGPCGVPEKPVPSSASTTTAQSARRAGAKGSMSVDALGVGARVAAQLAHGATTARTRTARPASRSSRAAT